MYPLTSGLGCTQVGLGAVRMTGQTVSHPCLRYILAEATPMTCFWNVEILKL